MTDQCQLLEESPHASKAVDAKAAVESAWKRFQNLARSSERPELVEQIAPAMEQLRLGLFRLVVVGEIKKGKSRFINALLGEPELLPTDSDVATSTVYKLVYGPQKRFKVFFLPDLDTRQRRSPVEIEPTALADYGTEKGNPGNAKRVEFIGIELPHPLLKEGLVMVDTPGVGGLYKSHRAITWRYAPNADAICFVLDSVEALISRDEIEFLKELTSKVSKKVFFVQTKTDAADTKQWQTFEKRNREHLIKHLGIPNEHLLYFTVSAKQKLAADAIAPEPEDKDGWERKARRLDRSGLPKVMQFLNRGLKPQKEGLLAGQAARRILMGCSAIEHQVKDQLRIAQAQGKSELDKIAAEIDTAKEALIHWERDVYPGEIRRFIDTFAELRLRCGGQLRQALDGVALVRPLVNELQTSKPDPRMLNQRAGEIQQALLSQAAESCQQIELQFRASAVQEMETTANRLSESFALEGKALVPSSGLLPAIQIRDTLNMEFRGFETLRYGMMGAGLGLGLVGLLVTVFPPAGAIAGVLYIAAALLVGKKGLEQLEEQKRAEAIQKLERELTTTLAQASNQAQQHFAELAQQVEQHARKAFDQAAKTARTQMQARIREVDSARQANGQEHQKRLLQLRDQIEQVRVVQRDLAALFPSQANTCPKARHGPGA